MMRVPFDPRLNGIQSGASVKNAVSPTLGRAVRVKARTWSPIVFWMVRGGPYGL